MAVVYQVASIVHHSSIDLRATMTSNCVGTATFIEVMNIKAHMEWLLRFYPVEFNYNYCSTCYNLHLLKIKHTHRSKMAAVQDILSPLPDISPERLTMLKTKYGSLNRDVFSEPSSPTGDRVMDFSNSFNRVNSVTARRSSGRLASDSQRRSSFLYNHRTEMSSEIIAKVCHVLLSSDNH